MKKDGKLLCNYFSSTKCREGLKICTPVWAWAIFDLFGVNSIKVAYNMIYMIMS